jgi:hypothetical protein
LPTKTGPGATGKTRKKTLEIEWPVWYTIYHHLPVAQGVSSNPSIHQPTNGKRTSMIGKMTLIRSKMENHGIFQENLGKNVSFWFFKS